ncbi:ArnT family glycosyltransferase [Bradyrhizobium sp. 2TAF24]|uniref:ArnT family glycosyltransferase n=1 Tax=Bradyrhizobium sp. 2TAF24 TaxID=3233011 RepID=UPI003F911397
MFLHIFFIPGQWLLARFNRLDQARHPLIWIMALAVLMTVPALLLRAAHHEEGTVIALARGALEDGHWLTPFRYGARFAERPVLLSWIIATLGAVVGEITVPLARLPHIAFLILGGVMVYDLVKPLGGKAAGLFGALCWLASPMVAQKAITAEPDVTTSVLLFSAFWLWWTSTAAGRLTLGRWLMIGALMGIAGLAKGPQPVAYVTLGVGIALLVRREIAQLPGFVLANAIAGIMVGAWYVAVAIPSDVHGWAVHSRLLDLGHVQLVRDHLDFVVSLVAEWLPGTLLLGPALVILWRGARGLDAELLRAALIYALACSLVLLAWPGGVATRYAMPANPALAVMCGVMFARWRGPHSRVIVSTLVIGGLIATYVVVLSWIVMPLMPRLFQDARIAGTAVQAVRRDVAGPVYVLPSSAEHNMLAYVAGPIREVPMAALATLRGPALAVVTPQERAALAQLAPDLPWHERTTVQAGGTALGVYEIAP